ncbi:MAG: MFS transporter [Muribaculaceae bacterium]|nr:MFS transporter [Muribaculaceae bacterium]
MKKALLALALGTFALGIAEFTMMGILGNLASDLGITVSKAGGLITAYAIGVCCGAPCLLFARRQPLKRLMLIMAAVIALGNALMTIAPNYGTMWAARFISGLPHGAYFGVGAIVARQLSAPGREAASVSFMIAGMTIATLLGVPMATFITDAVSWRLAFGIVAFAGIVTFIMIRIWVPQVRGLKDIGFWGQFKFLGTLAPWLIFGGVLFGQIGLYCWYSYIDPQMVHVAHFTASDMSWIMVLAGLGMFIGNLTCGQLAVRYKPSIVASTVQACGIIVLIAIYFLAGSKFASIVLMMLGTAILFGSGSPLQSSIVVYSRGGEMLGAALIQIAYNAGNAIAAGIGGTVIARGYGYTAPALAGVPLVLIGSILLLILYLRHERSHPFPA